jgi:hypothetical protein
MSTVIFASIWGALSLLTIAGVTTLISLRWSRLLAVASYAGLLGVLLGLAPAISLGWTLATDPDPLLGSGANWVRNHHMGVVVDKVEQWRYSQPPSLDPATELNLVVAVSEPPVTIPTAPTVPPTRPTQPIRQPVMSEANSTTVPPVIQFVPEDLIVVVTPALVNEGRWTPLTDPDQTVAMWATAIRPSAAFPSVTATVVSIDTSAARFVLHNGTELPGGSWAAGSRLDLSPTAGAIAAFNGGFRFEHIAGGYMTEGTVVRPLVDGEVAIAINSAGQMRLGVWGRDLTAAGDWVSVRQSLRPIVDGGVNQARGTWQEQWGVDFGNVTYVLRSAICMRSAQELLYVVAGDVDAALMADIMISLGCSLAMQLDINGNWPQFAVLSGVKSGSPKATLIDARMSNTGRYLYGSKKDFIGIYHNPK